MFQQRFEGRQSTVRVVPRNWRRSFIGATLLATVGCAVSRSAKIPMEQIIDQLPQGQGQRHLVVFLPGVYDDPQDFIRYGFIAALRRRRLAADVIAIDSHLGYFNDYSIAERMRDDVLTPAKDKGYQKIWLVGISLGGFGSLLTLERYSGISGIVALAPFIATPDAIAEVRRSGGLRQWRSDTSTATNEWERRLLAYLARYDPKGPAAVPIILGYGLQDRFAESLAEVVKVLEPNRVLTQAGGHEWTTWSALWNKVLDRFAAEMAPTLA